MGTSGTRGCQNRRGKRAGAKRHLSNAELYAQYCDVFAAFAVFADLASIVARGLVQEARDRRCRYCPREGYLHLVFCLAFCLAFWTLGLVKRRGQHDPDGPGLFPCRFLLGRKQMCLFCQP